MHPSWPSYLRILLAIHIAFGAAAFVCAPVALVAAKGGSTHRKWGKIYFWCMAGVAVSAVVLSLMLPIPFLLMVAVFSFYAAFAAYRILFLKQMYRGAKAQPIDWIAAILTIASSIVLFILGIMKPRLMGVGIIDIAGHQVSIVSIVFGVIGVRLGVRSIREFASKPTDKMFWWYSHLQGMIASYIAAMTAFSAVNLTRVFGAVWWVWLWPTMLGVPAIILSVRYYKRKFAPRVQPTQAA